MTEREPWRVPSSLRINLHLDDLLAQLQDQITSVVEVRDRLYKLLNAVVSIGSDLLLNDVLVHFNQARKLATLRALADITREVQVILFTHERDAVDTAQAHLRDHAVIHQLARRG